VLDKIIEQLNFSFVNIQFCHITILVATKLEFEE